MTVDELRLMLAYNEWANDRLLNAAEAVSPADFVRDLGGSFGSLRGTLTHLVWGERGWLHYWVHGTFLPDPELDAHPDVASVRQEWRDVNRDRLAFAAPLDDTALARLVAVREHTYTLAELFQHVLNHSTYHRGQIALLIRQLGHAPPATDYRLFLNSIRLIPQPTR
jgi:uncharacterized damage-inducible protein DinB